MLYRDFIDKAIEQTLVEADNNSWYLEPEWKHILFLLDLNVNDITDYKTEWSEIEDVLKLEVQKRNTILSSVPAVSNWIFDLITSSVEPAVLQEETSYIQALSEYLKAKKGPKS